MYFKQIIAEGLGCFSYVIGCPMARQCVVVDPKRDIQEYLDISQQEGMRITHIIETHIHADHVSGNQELRSVTGADIYFHESAPVKFPHSDLKEGDIIEFGNVRLEILHTPGHTPHSISILVSDLSRSEEPWIILTGDLLFVGDIGRPDLAGEEILDEQIKNLYESLYYKLGRFPGRIEVFPAHGQGSLCGGGMSAKTSSTIGFERHNNPLLQMESLDEFVKKVKEIGFPPRPKSFSKIIEINASGAPLLEKCPSVRRLDPVQFKELMKKGAVVIDTRDSLAFGGGHIPGSINIGFEKGLANWVGMAVEPGSEILLVVNSEEQYNEMCVHLHRIGYDNILGYLYGGMNAWQIVGFEIDHLPQISVHELKMRLEMKKISYLIDVRTKPEWEQFHIEGAIHIPLSEILEGKVNLPKDQEIVTYCRSGYRGNIAASHMKRLGFENVKNLSGAITAWINAGYPVVRD
jgi:glyoxylase-like metal-dependent hydrolase (beta-lactamase superfamily II)/rhodanese-related sulfurtransferase